MNKRERCIAETKEHIESVRKLTKKVALAVIERGEAHDASKLVEPELSYFVKAENIAEITFGSEKDIQQKEGLLKPALDHHYAHNRHHPQHYPDGIKGMNIIDLVEMICDWKASSTRHNDGNLLKSIEINANRFNISDDLVAILRNTAELLEL